MLETIGSIVGAGAIVAWGLWAIMKKMIPGAMEIIGKRI